MISFSQNLKKKIQFTIFATLIFSSSFFSFAGNNDIKKETNVKVERVNKSNNVKAQVKWKYERPLENTEKVTIDSIFVKSLLIKLNSEKPILLTILGDDERIKQGKEHEYVIHEINIDFQNYKGSLYLTRFIKVYASDFGKVIGGLLSTAGLNSVNLLEKKVMVDFSWTIEEMENGTEGATFTFTIYDGNNNLGQFQIVFAKKKGDSNFSLLTSSLNNGIELDIPIHAALTPAFNIPFFSLSKNLESVAKDNLEKEIAIILIEFEKFLLNQ